MAFRIGVAGLGVVGASVIKIIQESQLDQFEIVAVSFRDPNKDRGVDLSGYVFEPNAMDLLNHDLDCVIETIGGDEGIAKELIFAAIDKNVQVVTANKALISKYIIEIEKKSKDQKIGFFYEASAAASIPVVETLKAMVQTDTCMSVSGILNGTCNYILSKMIHEGVSYDSALRIAQEIGYAETPPDLDVGGFDTAHKIKILAAIAFGQVVDMFEIKGIEHITQEHILAAREEDYIIKLLGSAVKAADGISLCVAPFLVPVTHPLATIDCEMNAVNLEMAYAGKQTLIGAGAGGYQTASAVVSDMMKAAGNNYTAPFGAAALDSCTNKTPSFKTKVIAGTEFYVLA